MDEPFSYVNESLEEDRKLTAIREAWANFRLHLPDGSYEGLGDVTEAITKAMERPADATREQFASWLITHSFSTGHGDTFEDLLKELEWQISELRQYPIPTDATRQLLTAVKAILPAVFGATKEVEILRRTIKEAEALTVSKADATREGGLRAPDTINLLKYLDPLALELKALGIRELWYVASNAIYILQRLCPPLAAPSDSCPSQPPRCGFAMPNNPAGHGCYRTAGHQEEHAWLVSEYQLAILREVQLTAKQLEEALKDYDGGFTTRTIVLYRLNAAIRAALGKER